MLLVFMLMNMIVDKKRIFRIKRKKNNGGKTIWEQQEYYPFKEQ